jgi:hypothetical protein
MQTVNNPQSLFQFGYCQVAGMPEHSADMGQVRSTHQQGEKPNLAALLQRAASRHDHRSSQTCEGALGRQFHGKGANRPPGICPQGQKDQGRYSRRRNQEPRP